MQDAGVLPKTYSGIEACFSEAVKLGYLVVTALKENTIEIKKHAPVKKNGNEWTLWNKKNPSDHLPIGVNVTIK